MNITRSICVIVLLLFLTLISFLLSLSYGSVSLSFNDLVQVFFQGSHHSLTHEIVMQLRLPRTVNAFITGGLLAASGCLLQTLLRNPLADPYILGVSGGCAVASLIGLFLGVTGYSLPLLTFAGGIGAMLIVFQLSYQVLHWDRTRLLLTGVIFGAGANAAMSLILTLSPDVNLRGMLFWLLGDLNGSELSFNAGFILLLSIMAACAISKDLDRLSYGELKAQSLGVNTRRITLIIYFLSALMTATAVSIAGCIGFIGLMTPHLLRLLNFHRHQALLPGCVLMGGSLMMLADTFARTVFAPEQLPVGVVTALLGVPVFFLLARG